jgi:hypothetical protein
MSRTERLAREDQRIVAEAEADLQRLLSIEPSPEFAARVRARIHEPREPRASRWGWIGLAIATAAALTVAAMIRSNQSAPASQRVENVRLPDTILRDVPPERATLPPSTTPRRRVAVTTRTAAAASPEIIIDSAMTQAIQRMARSLRSAEPDASTAEQLKIQMGEPAPLMIAEPLNVRELVVKPADQNGGNQE